MFEAWTGIEPWSEIRTRDMSRDSFVLLIARQRKPPTMPPARWEMMSDEFKNFYNKIFEMVGVRKRKKRGNR